MKNAGKCGIIKKIIEFQQEGDFLNTSTEYVEKINAILSTKDNANIYILNDKLTLSVFSVLEKNLKNVNKIYFIIRDSNHLPKEQVSREFEMNPNETLFNEYDIIEKNELTHFAKAKAMHDFIKKHVEIRRIKPPAKVGVNILIIDEEYMISGTTSLELSDGRSEQVINFNSVVNEAMDKKQIVDAKKEFERIWHSEQLTIDYKDKLLKSLTFVYKEHSPEFAYYFTLNELFGKNIDEGVERFERENVDFRESKIWNMLFDFQKEAVQYAIQKINKYNGCIIADSVGLGKTFEALAVMKYFSDRQDNILVLTPAKLYNNWDSYRDNDYYDNPLIDDNIKYKVMCHTDLSRYEGTSRSGIDLARFDWSRFDLIVIDESHNFRNRVEKEDSETRYQRLLETVIKRKNRTKVLLLSATPVNNSLTDLKNQISIITADRDDAFEREGIESVAQTLRKASAVFNSWEKNGRTNKSELYDALPKDFFDLLELLTISRSRKHITNYYNSSDIGKFPTKLPVSTYNPNIDCENKVLNFRDTLAILEELLLAVYTPMRFLKSEYKQMYREKYQTIHKGKTIFTQADRDNTTKILHMFNLFKRLESSVYSFDKTLEKMLGRIDNYIQLLESNSADTVTEFEYYNEEEEPSLDYKLDIKVAHLNIPQYLEALYFDRGIVEKLREQAQQVLVNNRDEKLLRLRKIIQNKITETPFNAGNRKILIFSAFADTARYLYENISEELLQQGYYTAMVSGSDKPKTTLPSSFERKYDFNKILTYFSPISKNGNIPPEREITVLIGTDCISEGQNLQDCDTVINFDIQWNPVTLIQRFGRIDRIGSRNDNIKLINFFPAMDLNEYLGLETRVKKKMIQSNVVSTGADDLLTPEMNDLNFRTKQMEKLRSEVIDLDEATDTISITDLNMNQYLYELSQYIKHNPELLDVPRGIYSIARANEIGINQNGVLFCFKYKNNEEKPSSESSLYPYYLAFISLDGEIVFESTQARELLKRYRGLCYGKYQVNENFVADFLKETKNTKDMSAYSELLSKVVASIQKVEEDNAGFTLFDFGGFKNTFANKTSDDFELVSFVIVRKE